MEKTENNKVGHNDKVFTVRKDGHITIRFTDVVTKEKTIKQSILQRFLFVNAFSKERETLRKYILDALNLGYGCNGKLQASITPVKPKKILDSEKLNIFLVKSGTSIDAFMIDGKEGERLIVE
jgi:hypothetical protein